MTPAPAAAPATSCGLALVAFRGKAPAALLAATALALAAGGCGAPDERAAIEARLHRKGAAEVEREAAAARYTPPGNGRLSEAQVRAYLAVRERECRIRETAAAAAAGRRHDAEAAAEEAALIAAADLRAAQELQVNPKEYAWVRDRVLEARAAATAHTLYLKMAAGREQLLARKRQELLAISDPAQRAAAEHEVEDWQRGLSASEPTLAPSVRANVSLLGKFRAPLAHLRGLEERALTASM